MRDIKESDWKCFKVIRELALRRHCQKTLDQLAKLATENVDDPHERYLKIYKYVHMRDKEVALLFNDFRRSTAIRQLSLMVRKKALTMKDLADLDRFSEEVISSVEKVQDL